MTRTSVVAVLFLATSIPLFAKDKSITDYPEILTVRSGYMSSTNRIVNSSFLQGFPACSMDIEGSQTKFFIQSTALSCRYFEPGTHIQGRKIHKLGYPIMELAWTDDAGKVHVQKYNIVDEYYYGK